MKRSNSVLFITIYLNLSLVYGQAKPTHDWYLSQSNGGLCNLSILLFADSTYCSESGCETSSHFSFGKWRMRKDTILFMPADLKNIR
jgi:hypothetical protein